MATAIVRSVSPLEVRFPGSLVDLPVVEVGSEVPALVVNDRVRIEFEQPTRHGRRLIVTQKLVDA